MPNKSKKSSNQFINRQAKPTVLDSQDNINIDTKNTLADNIIEAGLTGGLNAGVLESFTSISSARDQMYQLIDTMAQDSTVSSILRTYAEDVCETADNGHIVWCESADPKISKYVNYILNVMNVDKSIFGWAYSLLKYGDLYLKLFRESDFDDLFFKADSVKRRSQLNEAFDLDFDKKLTEDVKLNIHSNTDPYSYYIEAVADPGSMFELTKYGKTYGYIEVPVNDTGVSLLNQYLISNTNTVQNYRMRSNDVNIYQADDFVHACLDDANARFPEKVEIFTSDNPENNSTMSYTVKRGKSLLYDSYKVWREKTLLESSALLNRITKSSVVRIVQVDIKDMSKEQAQQTLRRVKELMEQKSAINTDASNAAMTEYTNPGPVENNIYMAVHDGAGAISVNAMGGDFDPKQLTDLDWWNKKFFSSYGIPPQFFGWTDDAAGFNGGTSLSIISSVYAKGVKRVQNALVQALSDAISLILLNKGYRSYVNNFTLKMKTPLTQEERDYREDLSNRITAISNMNGLFTDIEDKERRLKILKDLVATLNYGDGLITEIDAEINALAAKRKEEEAAAKIEENNNTTIDSTEETLDLGTAGAAALKAESLSLPNIAPENILLENQEDPSLLINDSLPTPEELAEDINFVDNTDDN